MIETQTKYFPASNDGVPAFALQITKLVDSYMLWIGVVIGAGDDVEQVVEKGKLCKDWACAMPPRLVRSFLVYQIKQRSRRCLSTFGFREQYGSVCNSSQSEWIQRLCINGCAATG